MFSDSADCIRRRVSNMYMRHLTSHSSCLPHMTTDDDKFIKVFALFVAYFLVKSFTMFFLRACTNVKCVCLDICDDMIHEWIGTIHTILS